MLSYLGVMMIILGSTGLVVYRIINHHLHQQFEDSALKLAENAGVILDLIKHEHQEYFSSEDFNLTLRDLIITSEKHQQKLESSLYGNHYLYSEENLSIEWLNEQKNILVKEGKIKVDWQEFKIDNVTKYYDYDNGLFSLILPIKNYQKNQLIGYVKIIESTTSLDENLFWLRWSLILGGGFALILTTGGAFFLTQQSLKPIMRSYQELKQFTADASHELRNPLTVIKTSADILLTETDSLKIEDITKLKVIASATEEMKILVDDLLLLARMDKNIRDEEKSFILLPLDEICEDLLDYLSFEADLRQITLKYDLSPEIQIKGNGNQIQRLLTNILHNALQYTSQGGEVRFTLKKESHWVTITIEDTGIGIPSGDLPFIFQRFWRGERGRNQRQEGCGLGLAIAKKIIDYHGGKITVESVVSQGSSFKIYFPLTT